VRVISYNNSHITKYQNLEGLIVDSKLVRNRPVFLVLLDTDPTPHLQAMLGGLPCYDFELEVI
jgi:hypothetical protein